MFGLQALIVKHQALNLGSTGQYRGGPPYCSYRLLARSPDSQSGRLRSILSRSTKVMEDKVYRAYTPALKAVGSRKGVGFKSSVFRHKYSCAKCTRSIRCHLLVPVTNWKVA